MDYFTVKAHGLAERSDGVNNDLPESCRGVQQFLSENGTGSQVRIVPGSARTAQEAADALGCTAAQIAKSVIFRAKTSDRPVLVIACGDNRVNEKKVAALIGEKIGRANADFVLARTGFAIGGVAPFAHREKPLVLVDATVQRFARMWAAAGTPEALFSIATDDLIRLAGGPLADIAG
jgi:prolyl-tRNA editing enzyme YbaK/EbsC (Cys-tRNA(Pro) deacylase)